MLPVPPKLIQKFKGNVKSVETRDFWRSIEQSPMNQGYHYNRNAETYLNVGQAMGRAMAGLLKPGDSKR